jgi:hypothetical protein
VKVYSSASYDAGAMSSLYIQCTNKYVRQTKTYTDAKKNEINVRNQDISNSSKNEWEKCLAIE